MESNIDNVILKKQGERLKALMIEFGLHREDVSKLINYSLAQISYICSGERQLTEQSAKILSKEWGIRKQYILCEDDYRTDADCLAGEDKETRSRILANIEYLRSIGFSVDIQHNLTFSNMESFYSFWNGIKEIFLEFFLEIPPEAITSSKEDIEEMFDNLPNEDLEYNTLVANTVINEIYSVLLPYILNKNDKPNIDDIKKGYVAAGGNIMSFDEDRFLKHMDDDKIFNVSFNENIKLFSKNEFLKFMDAIAKNTAFIFETFF